MVQLPHPLPCAGGAAKFDRIPNPAPRSASVIGIITAAVLTCLAALPSSLAREWTNQKGKTITAEIVKADSDTVTLKMPDGATPVVKLTTLSQADQDFVKQWLMRSLSAPKSGEAETGEETPPAKPGVKDAPPGLPCSGFDGKWPKEVSVPEELNVETVKEDDTAGIYIYRSTHFEFTSNVQLKKRLVSECAKVFETTHEYLRLLPLNNILTGPGRGFFLVQLFETREQYHAAGGVPGSAGVCITTGNKSRVLVPLESFGVRKTGQDYTIGSRDGNWHVLAHEITHQLMERQTKQAMWYSEGSAEYVGCTPYTGRRLKVSANGDAIMEYVTGYGKENTGGRNLGNDIKLDDLERFMTMSQEEFMKDGQRNYALGCLLTYYFYHLDGDGDAARIKNYLKSLQSGEPESKAVLKLMDGRTFAQLADDFSKGMRKHGLKIKCR